MPDIDLDKISAEVDGMSHDDLVKALIDIKTRQRIATRKYYNPETAKKARLNASAKQKAMVEKIKSLGLYDEVMKKAAEQADARLAEEEPTEESAA